MASLNCTFFRILAHYYVRLVGIYYLGATAALETLGPLLCLTFTYCTHTVKSCTKGQNNLNSVQFGANYNFTIRFFRILRCKNNL